MISMPKKYGTDIQIAEKIKEFLKAHKGEAFAVDRLAHELGVGWRRVKRLLKVAEILQDTAGFPYGSTTAYMIKEENS